MYQTTFKYPKIIRVIRSVKSNLMKKNQKIIETRSEQTLFQTQYFDDLEDMKLKIVPKGLEKIDRINDVKEIENKKK